MNLVNTEFLPPLKLDPITHLIPASHFPPSIPLLKNTITKCAHTLLTSQPLDLKPPMESDPIDGFDL
ncbi:Uncharacterized protein TCM_031607 [Theobroma cacao]|uniref:Uncharacterized protein n=1 Tax=Theobroma cacao TaxID=3641 RepID=A0A061FF35_THECC|nr:Uncharacterized protein TCM_031607 [Theobroma cacao]